jgi:phosphohistidine phosphatase
MASDMAAGFVARGVFPDKIICSSALRTRKTCELVAAGLPVAPAIDIEAAFYGGDSEMAMRRVRGQSDTFHKLMIIGHNPWIHAAVLALVASGELAKKPEIKAMYPPSSCAILTFECDRWAELARSSGTLVDFFFSMG